MENTTQRRPKKADTIIPVVALLNEEGYMFTPYALKQWGKQGLVRTIPCGRKKMYNVQSIRNYLDGVEGNADA